MSDFNTNLSKNAPKEFEKTMVPPQISNPSMPIDSDITENLKTDILNISNNKIAFGEEDLLYSQFIIKLKEFFEEQDATNAKSDIDDKLTTISSKVDELGVDKENLNEDIKNIKAEELVTKDTSDESFKLDFNNEFSKKIIENILSVINYNMIVNSTIENLIESIKSIIDGNADEFKQTLNDELNKDFELSKIKDIDFKTNKEEIQEETIEKEIQEETIEKEIQEETIEKEIQEEGNQEESINEKIPNIGEKEEIDENNKILENNIEDNSNLEKNNTNTQEKTNQSEIKKDSGDDKKISEFDRNQKAVDLQRKKKMLEVDKQLDEINNKYLKKLIESQDVVEEYDSRKLNTTKQKTKNKKIKTNDNSSGRSKFSWKKLGIGLGIGALVTLYILFRGYSRQVRIKKYIEEHKEDKDSKKVNGELESEIKFGDTVTKPLEKQIDDVEDDLNKTDPEVDKSIEEINKAKNDVDKKYGKEEENEELPIEQQEPNIEEIEIITEIDNTEIIKDEPEPVELDEEKVKDIFEESHEGIDKAMLDSMDESLNLVKSNLDKNINSNQDKSNKKNSEINTMLSKQQERLEKLNDKLKNTSDDAERESETLNGLEEDAKEIDEEVKDFSEKKNKEKDENVDKIKENQNKSEKEVNSSVQEMDESNKEAQDNVNKALKRNEENKKELEKRNQELAENTVPKSEFDAANSAAKEVSNELQSSNENMANIQNETLKTENSKTMESVKDISEQTDELSDKSNELDENVKKIEGEAEIDSQNSRKVDEAAAEVIKEKELLQINYENKANEEIDKLFNEYVNSIANQTNNDNLIMMNKSQLSQFYNLLHNTKNYIAQLVIKTSKDNGYDSIKNEAEKYLNLSQL